MRLPRLPPELFSDIIEYTVQLSEIKEAVRLRQVNQYFDYYALHHLGTSGLFKDGKKVRNLCQDKAFKEANIAPFLARFFLTPTSHEPGSWDSSIPSLLNHILDQALPGASPDERYAAMETLCAYIDKNSYVPGRELYVPMVKCSIVTKLYPESVWWSEISLPLDKHLAMAGILLGLPHVWEPWLSQQRDVRTLAPSPLFGTPLYIAAETGQVDLVQTFLLRGMNLINDMWNVILAATTNEDIQMIDLLLRNVRNGYIHLGCIKIQHCIIYAIRDGKDEVARMLLKHYHDIELPVAFNEGLREAVLRNNIGMVELLLNRGAEPNCDYKAWVDGSRYEVPTALHVSAWAGYDDLIHVLVARGVNVREDIFIPLRVATAMDRVDTVKLLLELSNFAETLDTETRGRLLNEAIEANSSKALPYLLREKRFFDIANIQPLSCVPERFYQPANLLVDACLCGSVPALEALLDCGVPVDLELQHEQFDRPIEAAMACDGPRGEAVVRLLCERGASRVDVTRIRCAELFKTVYPRKPQFLKCKMPHSFRFDSYEQTF